MKKLDQFIEHVDKEVDRRLQPWYSVFGRYFTLFSSVLFSFLLFFFIFKVYYEKPNVIASLIQEDIKSIHKALVSIDKACSILSMRGERIELNFFTVAKFIGSEIGGLQLAYPEKWKGPYLNDNPHFQQKTYELVTAQDGLFVVPGLQTKLPNGYVVGHDFQITPLTRVLPMLEAGGYLFYKGFVFGARVTFSHGNWSWSVQSDDELSKINAMFKEFNSALPFSHNNSHYYG